MADLHPFTFEDEVVTDIDLIRTISFDEMRLEFLRLSPAYAFMCDIANESLIAQNDLILKFYEENVSVLCRRKILKSSNGIFTKDERLRILAGFDFVRDTYKEYGNVACTFKKWARQCDNSPFLVNSYVNYPSTFLIAVQDEFGEPRSRFFDDAYGYLDSCKNHTHVRQPRILLSIPVNANPKIVADDVKKWMKEFALPHQNQKFVSVKPLVGKRVHYEATLKKMKLMMHKALRPHEPLWRLGLRARVSERYNKIAKDDLSGKFLSKDDIDILSATTSRSLTHAQYIAENAARGLFPLHKRIITPVFDYDAMRERLLLGWPDLRVQNMS